MKLKFKSCQTESMMKTNILPSLAALCVSLTFGLNSMAQVIDLTAIDSSANPCTDFYQYACGKWLERTEMKETKMSVSRSFETVSERNQDLLMKVIPEAGQISQKFKRIQEVYDQCMDQTKISERSEDLLKEMFSLGDAAVKQGNLEILLADYFQVEGGGVFPIAIISDFEHPQMNTTMLGMPTLLLDKKSDYTDAKQLSLRENMKKYMEAIFKEMGLSKDLADQVFSFETRMAAHTMDYEKTLNVKNFNNPFTYEGLKQKFPGFDWDLYITRVGLPSTPKKILIAHPEGLSGVIQVLRSTPAKVIQAYSFWHSVRTQIKYMSENFQKHFLAYVKIKFGVSKLESRNKICSAAAKELYPHLASQLFVEKAFSPQAKDDTLEMVQRILEEFKTLILEADWLDSSTRELALVKLSKIVPQIAYPDKWYDYKGLENGKDFFHSYLNKNRWSFKEYIGEFEQKIDRSDWGDSSVATVNAYYKGDTNQITFPAGILQSPFYSLHSSRIANLASIGVAIGHEITHGFDHQGRLRDADGALKNWWSESIDLAFKQRAQCLVDQFSEFQINGDHVDGNSTQGENIADLGGVKMAYRIAERTQETNKMVLKDWKREFFLAYAQTWCSKERPEFMKSLLEEDSHSPNIFRVNGVLQNMPEFAKTFSCKSTDSMVRVQRCEVW